MIPAVADALTQLARCVRITSCPKPDGLTGWPEVFESTISGFDSHIANVCRTGGTGNKARPSSIIIYGAVATVTERKHIGQLVPEAFSSLAKQPFW